MMTPFNLIKSLESWFFSRAWDVVLASGKKLVVSGADIEINSSGNLVLTGGNITLSAGTVDGVDISAHAADTDGHHNEAHTVASHSDTTGTGSELNTLTDGSNADSLHDHAVASHTIASHSDTTGTGAELNTLTDGSNADSLHDHAVGSHTIASHSDTTGTGSELNTLTDGSDASALHAHDGRYFQETEFSSNPGSNSKPLESNSSGELELERLTVGAVEATPTGVVISSSGLIRQGERSAPGTPASGHAYIWISTAGWLHWKSDDGTDHTVAEV